MTNYAQALYHVECLIECLTPFPYFISPTRRDDLEYLSYMLEIAHTYEDNAEVADVEQVSATDAQLKTIVQQYFTVLRQRRLEQAE